jgi:hypothetical protein
MFGFFRRRTKESERPAVTESCPELEAETRVIRTCRDRFGSPPRALDATALEACRLSLTPEVNTVFTLINDPLLRILAEQSRLRDRGQIVWGQIVQANQLLFDPDNVKTLAADVIYSLDPYFDGRVDLLAGIAHGLFARKGSVPGDPELREFVRVITDERSRIMRRELPRGYCGGRSVYFASCFIQPSHLPGNCLARSSFPLLVNFQETVAVMMLPSLFWPVELVSKWRT